MSTFADLGVARGMVDALAAAGIHEPFPIQQAVIETALAGRDVCGKAPTGSGKTLAFGIPVIQRCEAGEPYSPSALILAPTRELATQIKDELAPMAKANGRSILTVFGGTPINRDIKQLERGTDVLVACPGRLEDLVSRRVCDLRSVTLAVVDEADRMADMGFLPAVKRILDQIAQERQTLLFSATLDGAVDALITRYQTDPETFEVEDQADQSADVEHSWYLVQSQGRLDTAIAILRGHYSSIVFCRTRRGCDRVAKMINKRGLDAVAIHGDRSQAQRERALAAFTSGKAQVLVATDVAARGIHVDDVSLVMHYDPAGSDKDYIHRSGRTGRAGNSGRVISVVVEDKKKIARQLQKDLGLKPGFDTLDAENIPAPVERPQPKHDPDEHRDSGDRSDRKRSGQSRGRGDRNKGGQGGARGRNDGNGQRRNSRGRDGQRRDGQQRDGQPRDGQGRNGQGHQNNDRSRDGDNRGRSGKQGQRGQGQRGQGQRGQGQRGRNSDRYGDNRYDRDDRGGGNGQKRNNRGSDGQRRNDGDRSRNSRSDRPQQRRRKSNDWYPPGWEDDRDRPKARDRRNDREDEDQERYNTRSDGPARRSNSRNGPNGRTSGGPGKRGGSAKRSGQSRNGRGDRDGSAPSGGRNTTQRKNRKHKGRHADRTVQRDRGKPSR